VDVAGFVKVLPMGDGQDKSPRGIDHLKNIIDLDDLPRSRSFTTTFHRVPAAPVALPL
jgi:hypothetical protein